MPNAPTKSAASTIASQMLIDQRVNCTVANAPTMRNSPWARLITRIIPKITASPIEMIASRATLFSTEMAMFAT